MVNNAFYELKRVNLLTIRGRVLLSTPIVVLFEPYWGWTEGKLEYFTRIGFHDS